MSPIDRPLTRRTVLAGGCATAAALLLPTEAHADATSDALDEVAKAREKLKTLVAPFDQARVIGLLASEVKSKGELTMVRPDRLRWELFPPDAIVYFIGPEGISYKSGAGKSATTNDARFTGLLRDLMAFLGGDLKKLRERYDLSATSASSGVTIVAKPRTEDVKKLTSRIEMKTNAERWGVSRVVIEEPNGDKSTIDFGPNKRDVAVDPSRMKPPA